MSGVLKPICETIVCDIDNTLYNSLLRLSDLKPDYDRDKQTTYKLSSDELSYFYSPDFYDFDMRYINSDVYRFLVANINLGVNVIFMSQSENDEVHNMKYRLLLSLFDGLLDNVELYTSNSHEDIESLVSLYGDIIFIDDAPHRFDSIVQLNQSYIIVGYPYNKDYVSGAIGIFNT